MTEVGEKFVIEMLTTTVDGKLFGAGKCYVWLGGTPLGRCVAVRAGEEKLVTLATAAPRWLTERGLPRAVAEELVRDAMAVQE